VVLEDERCAGWAEDSRGSHRGRVLGALLDAARAALAECDYAAAFAHARAAISLDRFAGRSHRTAMLTQYAPGRAHEALDAASAVCSGANRRRRGTLLETDSSDRGEVVASIDVRELMAAIAAAPEPYRDAVVAVDVVGLSHRQASRRLRTREATITSRLSRGRQHVARALGEPASASKSAG
jgi:DNA-directed RNA polymerase specialized sigma24 family protein